MLRAHQLRLSTDVRRLLGRVTELLARMLMVLFVAHPLQVLADPELQFVPLPRLGDPPTAPPFAAQLFPESRIEAPPADGFVVDAQDREAVRVFYRGMYSLSEDVPMQWTGSYATGVAGTTAQLFQNATALRINWYRAMAGVPAKVALDATYNAKAQDAALMMSANNQLSHFPPSNWIYYTANGAEAAANSNLSLGNSGADAVRGYMVDNGTNNSAVGHRRWVLYPQTLSMGSGDVPGGQFNGSTVSPANALWVFDSNLHQPRPSTRDTFVAWPPKGHIPYQNVVGRWSFSYPGANFAQATVTMNPGGPVSVEPVATGFGENTIVWLPQGMTSNTPWPKPINDQSYAVAINNVLVNGTPQSFTYNVVIFDPDQPTPGAPLPTVFAPASAVAMSPFAVSVQAMPRATAHEVNLFRSGSILSPLTAANSGSNWTVNTTGGYTPIGATEFLLQHSQPRAQTLTLNKYLHVAPGASIAFDSRLGLATTDELAKVQISLDGGGSWQDIFSQTGNNQSNGTVRQTIGLNAFAGRVVRMRFAFLLSGGSFYSGGTNVGWSFTNIALDNISELTLDNWATLSPGNLSQSLVASSPGSYLLAARTQYQGTYFGDLGLGVGLQVSASATDVTPPAVPQALTAMPASASRIELTWNASSDAVGVTQYRVYRSSDNFAAPIATVTAPSTSYSDTGLAGSTSYSYKVAACDAAGNCSSQSAIATAQTQPDFKQLIPIILQLILD